MEQTSLEQEGYYAYSLLPMIPKVFFLLLFPQIAFAYLDPGTGNALLYLIFGLFGTLVYSFKSLFYKLKKLITRNEIEPEKEHPIAIFSEGKNYFYTFKPIIDALIKENVHFNYYSMDIHDPALTYLNHFMEAKYIGSGAKAYVFMEKIRSRFLLSTTPNIGNKNYPMKRPLYIESLIHVFHAIGDIAFYHKGSLDYYDEVLMPGDFVLDSIRFIEHKRSLKEKRCLSLGLPYYDLLHKSKNTSTESNGKTILIAPSWGKKGLLHIVGYSFIIELLKKGYSVILRFHPQSYSVETDLIQEVVEALTDFKNLTIDRNLDGTDSFVKTDLMISDSSGVRFDFAFIYEKPVISLDASIGDFAALEASDLDELWARKASQQMGPLLQVQDFDNICEHVEKSLSQSHVQIKDFKEATLQNIGCSGQKIATYLIEKQNNGELQ